MQSDSANYYWVGDLPKLKYHFHTLRTCNDFCVDSRFWEQYDDLLEYVDYFSENEDHYVLMVQRLDEMKESRVMPFASEIRSLLGMPSSTIWNSGLTNNDNKENEVRMASGNERNIFRASSVQHKTMKNITNKQLKQPTAQPESKRFEINLHLSDTDDDDFVLPPNQTQPLQIKQKPTAELKEHPVVKGFTTTTTSSNTFRKPTRDRKPSRDRKPARDRRPGREEFDLKQIAVQNLQSFKAMNRRLSSLTSQIEAAATQIIVSISCLIYLCIH
jgi:hypothetical protein